MRIAFISQPWNKADPPVESGSVAIWIYQVTRRLSQSCHVTVYARQSTAQKRVEHREGVCYRYISTVFDRRVLRVLYLLSRLFRRRRPYFASWLYYFEYIVRVSLDLRRAGCDIVHVQNLSQFVSVIRALNPTVRVVLHMHCEWLTQLDPNLIVRRLEKVDSVVGCSEYITERVRRRFPQFADRCRTIHNGVDVNRYSTKDHEKDKTVKRILFVGRISPDKGLHVLLDAFEKVAREYPLAHLDIIGPQAAPPVAYIFKLSDEPKVSGLISLCHGDYMTQLRDQLPPLLMGRVSFWEAVPHGALPERYAAADVYVQPSFTEAFGMPVAEAMAAGVPVVGTRIGGIPEIVQDGTTGRLVESGDAEGLAEAILGLLTDENLRRSMGASARTRAAELFSWEHITRNLLGLYDSLSRSHEGFFSQSLDTSVLSEGARPSGCPVQ